jgi:hypothetical protein
LFFFSIVVVVIGAAAAVFLFVVLSLSKHGMTIYQQTDNRQNAKNTRNNDIKGLQRMILSNASKESIDNFIINR